MAAQRLERYWELLAHMHAEGVRITCGSDAGIGPRKPHDVLPHGITLFGSIGWSNTEALTAATALAAIACGRGSRKGRLLPGFDADLLAVRGNPVEQLTDMFNVHAVVRAGTLLRTEHHDTRLDDRRGQRHASADRTTHRRR